MRHDSAGQTAKDILLWDTRKRPPEISIAPSWAFWVTFPGFGLRWLLGGQLRAMHLEASYWYFRRLLLAMYVLPTAIALGRRHPQRRTIIAINLLLGWTIVGWCLSWVWSLAGIIRRRSRP